VPKTCARERSKNAGFRLTFGFRLKISYLPFDPEYRAFHCASFGQSRVGSLMSPLSLSNSWCTLLFPWLRARLVEQAGGEVARECRGELWQRVRRQVASMSVPEIRGYVRAHAAGIAAAQVETVLSRRSLKPSLGTRVLASGIDQLVSMTVRDALIGELPAEVRPLAA
jgi:hypothetical protein